MSTPRGLERTARQLVARDGGVLRRPLADGPEEFDLAYARTGPRGRVPVIIVPGGPGLASLVPYRSLRALAARHGLDVLMVEHRGVGLSGRTDGGGRLPVRTVTSRSAADDIAAVLRHERTGPVVVVGSSYGTCLAQILAVRHPDLVHTLVLDSPLLSPVEDLAVKRAHRRALLWEGTDPRTGVAAELVRQVAASEPMETLSHIVQVVYEFAGPRALTRLLQARLRGRGRWLWNSLASLGTGEVEGEGVPFYLEPDAVAGILFGELGAGLPPDGLPLDPQLAFTDVATGRPAFVGPPVDLPTEATGYPWPTLVMSGDRDLRTPRPVAERLVELVPEGWLVPLRGHGHSALDTHQRALVAALVSLLDHGPGVTASRAGEFSSLRRRGASAMLGPVIRAATRLTSPVLLSASGQVGDS